MAATFPVSQAGDHLAELVNRARHGHERVVLTDHGEPAAVLVSVDELDELQQAQDAAEIALCMSVKARNSPGMTHGEFMAMLDAEDGLSPPV